MLGFLRRIRRSLLDDGQLRKYLLYAVGEIVLVMVGILLALQVNNLNEARKDRSALKKVLQTISLNLEADLLALTTNIERAGFGIQYFNTLQEHPSNDSLASFFIERIAIPYMPVDNAGYISALSNNQLTLIQDPALQAGIISYYEKHFQDSQRIVALMTHVYEELFDKAFNETVKLKEEESFGRRMSIVLNDASFQAILTSYTRIIDLMLIEFQQRRDYATQLKSNIDNELQD